MSVRARLPAASAGWPGGYDQCSAIGGTVSTALNNQTVTVTGVDDAAVDGAIAYAIVTAAATSGDPAYGGLNPPDVSVTNQDNEVACPSQRPNVQVTSTKGRPGS